MMDGKLIANVSLRCKNTDIVTQTKKLTWPKIWTELTLPLQSIQYEPDP